MKFRMFTDGISGGKIAVNVDMVIAIHEIDEGDFQRGKLPVKTQIVCAGPHRNDIIWCADDFDTVFSRLNTIAE